MLSFNQFNLLVESAYNFIAPSSNILEEQVVVNKHSTHIEEMIFTRYKQGLADAIEGLTYIIKNIGKDAGNFVSVKRDGNPSCMLAWVDGKFAVASKSIFNKNPKINFTEQDIDANHPAGLAAALKACLNYLGPCIPKNGKWYQGDLLFTEQTLKSVTVDHRPCWMFHPNTIAYTVGKDSDLGKRIAQAKIGIAMHTEYDWDQKDLSTLQVTRFGIKDDIFKPKSDVFLIDTVGDLNAKRNMEFTEQQYIELAELIHKTEQLGDRFDWSILSNNNTVSVNLMTFINSYIRQNVAMPEPEKRIEQFFDWINVKMEKDVESKKTEKGKTNARAKYEPLLSLSQRNKELVDIFKMFDYLTRIKLIVLSKLNDLTQYNNFVITSNGDMINTGEEGFVISQTSAKGAKLVDRYTFSRNNFSRDIVKGWDGAR